MKKYLLWSFERGSRAYDVICVVILASIFLTDLFTFYYQQLGAVADLAVDLILLAVFEALLEAEHRRAGRAEATAG